MAALPEPHGGGTPDPPELVLRSRVPFWAAGVPLAAFLAQRFRYRDEAGWRAEIAAGRLRLDGRPTGADARLARGQRLEYRSIHREPAAPLEVPVLHGDASLLVVHKPALLPSHADGAFVRHTLVHQLSRRHGRLWLVHRLDRETSGLMVVARTRAAHRELDRQFRGGEVEKAYLAVVQGRVRADFIATGAIGPHPRSELSLRRAVLAGDAPGARPARTEVALLAAGAQHSLVRCVPRTGRTHQIRVHLHAAGHPVLGDKLYGRTDEEWLAFVRHVKAGGAPDRWGPLGDGPGRQLLHAAELAFVHPATGRRMAFAAPAPEDFSAWAPGGSLG